MYFEGSNEVMNAALPAPAPPEERRAVEHKRRQSEDSGAARIAALKLRLSHAEGISPDVNQPVTGMLLILAPACSTAYCAVTQPVMPL